MGNFKYINILRLVQETKTFLVLNTVLSSKNPFCCQSAGIFKQSMWARIRVPVIVPDRQATYAGGINNLESIPGLFIRLKIRALFVAGKGLKLRKIRPREVAG